MSIIQDINGKESMDKAIVDKVESVLQNAKFTQSIHIEIDGEVGSAPLIEYKITELIMPKAYQKGEERIQV